VLLTSYLLASTAKYIQPSYQIFLLPPDARENYLKRSIKIHINQLPDDGDHTELCGEVNSVKKHNY